MNVMRRTLHLSLALAIAATALLACREEEQGRPLSFNKGVYGGPKDEAVSTAAVQQMHERVKKQTF